MSAAIETSSALASVDAHPATAVPTEVAAALELLLGPRQLSPAAWDVTTALMVEHRVDEASAMTWAAEELAVVEATERVKAWADSLQLAALRGLRTAEFEQLRRHNDDLAMSGGAELPAGVLEVEADTMTVDEVMLATGLSQTAVSQRLDLARDVDGRGVLLTQALARGEVEMDRALRIHRATKGLGTEQAVAVSARLLERARDGSVRSHQWLRRELRRQVVLHAPDAATARAEAVRNRCAYAVMNDLGADGDAGGLGVGTLLMTAEAGRVAAAIERIDDLARRARADGDPRTLAQLRSDIGIDLVLFGWADPAGVPEAARATFVGQAPVAHVDLVVSLATLLGWEDGVAEIRGHGCISGDHARQLAAVPGSVWRRLVTDPVTGAAVELSTHRYRPTRAMADQLAALDGSCRWPGCVVPAHRCDIDHQRPWPAGATTLSNLSHKHRRHHNHKTRGAVSCLQSDDGVVLWRTATGRRYRTARHDYDDPLSRPVSEPEIDRALTHDPPPF